MVHQRFLELPALSLSKDPVTLTKLQQPFSCEQFPFPGTSCPINVRLTIYNANEQKTKTKNLHSLASPLASYVSGHTLEVTGGLGI